jgi:sortase A
MRRRIRTVSDDPTRMLRGLLAVPPMAHTGIARQSLIAGALGRRPSDQIATVLMAFERGAALALVLLLAHWMIEGPLYPWWRGVLAQPAVAQIAAQPPPAAPAAVADVPLPSRAAPAAPEVSVAPRRRDVAPRPAAHAGVPERLVVPAIALDTAIGEMRIVDGAWQVLDDIAGYLHGTGRPGEPGTMALAGHAGVRGAVFRDLGALAIGDEILVDADGWRYTYRVTEIFSVLPTHVEVLAPRAEPTLLLLTCTDWDTRRLVIAARLAAAVPIGP